MVDKEINLEERVARRNHVVMDRGTGWSYCGHCNYDLGNDMSVKYETCPKCEYKLVEGGINMQRGGLDPEFYR